jgi:hypothetical protein
VLHSVQDFTPEYVLNEFCDDSIGIKEKSKSVTVPEGTFDCYINSQRYLLFKRDGLVCTSCGKTATICKLELPKIKDNNKRAHFNFYCEIGNKTILLTKDHKISKSNGGKDVMDNYTPMCQECNTNKGSKGKLEDIHKAVSAGLADPIPNYFTVTIPKSIKNKPEYINIILLSIKLIGGEVSFTNKKGIRTMTVTLPTPCGIKHIHTNIIKLIGILVDANHHTTVTRTLVQ